MYTVLVISCHPDDMEICCAGTLLKCKQRGDRVVVCHLSSGNLGHEIIPPDELRVMRANEAKRSGAIGGFEIMYGGFDDLDMYADNKEVCDTAISYLKAINEKLEGTPFKVAYRTRNEFLLYVVNNLPYNKNENGEDIPQELVIARALDEITNMKILSRIEGDETKVSERFLNDLRETIKKELNKISQKEYSGTKGKEGTEYAVSLAKLKEMIARLGSGYTSFWS